ncbi:hypothetical protein GCM10010195_27440 [Kitasatospora griseola]|nr:hypothetical protein GCM10010195_27440 [Kitasatospora griseola]
MKQLESHAPILPTRPAPGIGLKQCQVLARAEEIDSFDRWKVRDSGRAEE